MKAGDGTPKPKRKKLFFALGAGVAVALVGAILVASGIVPNVLHDDDTIINPNVVVYDEESSPFKIVASDNESIMVSSLEGIKDDTILSAGITEQTPNGLLRKIVSTEPVDGGYKIVTEPATLTEAIEKCDITATATLGEDGAYTVTQIGGTKSSLFGIPQAFADTNALDNLFSVQEKWFSASAGDETKVSLKIDFGNIEVRITNRFYAGVTLTPMNGSFEKKLFEKELPPFTISVLGLPVVMKNDLNVNLSADYAFSLLTFTGKASVDKTIGCEYTSAEGLKPINEDHSVAPFISFNPEQEMFSASLDAALTATFGTYLYDFAGPNLSMGLDSKTDALLRKIPGSEKTEDAFTIPGLDWQLGGRITEKITVPITGTFVVRTKDPFNPFEEKPFEWVNLELFDTDDTITLLDLSFESQHVPQIETYTTKLGEKTKGDCPSFEFKYLDNWKMTSSNTELPRKGVLSNMGQGGCELVTLENEKGRTINFSYFTENPGGLGRFMGKAKIEKVIDSDFVPAVAKQNRSSDAAPFMIAKVTPTGSLFMDTDTDYTPLDNKPPSFAVLPVSWLGEREGLRGIGMISYAFNCDGLVSFIGGGGEEGFTDTEMQEVMWTLASLRVA